jgi:hypothetical protein
MQQFSYILIFCIFFNLSALFAQPKTLINKSVRFVYLVSQDRTYNAEYAKAIEKAAIDVQAWYKKQLNGYTFKLNSPVVEVAYSDKETAYFNGKDKPSAGYFVVLAEVNRLLQARQSDPNYVWVIYSDAPDHSGRGGGGVCIMPENDLIGLIGQSTKYPDIKRWYGGLGHEIGHAFGLPHPSDTKKYEDAIMWTGMYFKYPDQCYLTESDKEILNQSSFFFDEKGIPIVGQIQNMEEFTRKTGFIVRSKNTKTGEITWRQSTDQGNSIINFKEIGQKDGYFHLQRFGGSTTFGLKIPINGGQSLISTETKPEWTNFEIFTKTKDEKGKTIESKYTLLTFNYIEGNFKRLRNQASNEITWLESKNNSNVTFEFVEKSVDNEYYYLKAINRNIEIRIPRLGGQSQISTNEGQTWRNFQTMTKLKEIDSMRFQLPKRTEEILVEPVE